MNWKFWKRNKKQEGISEQKSARANSSADLFSRLPKPYAQQQILALQRVVGNRAVLRLLGISEAVPAKTQRCKPVMDLSRGA